MSIPFPVVAVIGGGASGIAAALSLTGTPFPEHISAPTPLLPHRLSRPFLRWRFTAFFPVSAF